MLTLQERIDTLVSYSEDLDEFYDKAIPLLQNCKSEIARLGELVEKSIQLCNECGKGFVDGDWAVELQQKDAEIVQLEKQLVGWENDKRSFRQLIKEHDEEVVRLKQQLADCKAAYEIRDKNYRDLQSGAARQEATVKSKAEAQAAELALIRTAAQGIIDIGKRDMSNPKYDGYFDELKDALTSRTHDGPNT